MPTQPAQIFLLVLEVALLFGGAGLLLLLLARRGSRQRWLHTHVLPLWNIAWSEFALFLALALLGAGLFPALARVAFDSLIKDSTNNAGLQVMIYGSAMHAGFLAAWLVFPRLRAALYSEYGSGPLASRPAPPTSFAADFQHGTGTLLVALPVVGLVSLAWTELLRLTGLPAEPQELLDIFRKTDLFAVKAGMIVVACVLAPISEELVFRAGVYRFLRQRLGRTVAVIVSGLCFGALHLNLNGLLPLAVLGALFALAYEATGSIRVTIIAHALFNLNTLAVLLSGIAPNA